MDGLRVFSSRFVMFGGSVFFFFLFFSAIGLACLSLIVSGTHKLNQLIHANETNKSGV